MTRSADVVVFFRIYLLGRFLRNKLGYNVASHDVRFIGASQTLPLLYTRVTAIHMFSVSMTPGRLHQVDLSSVWFAVKYSFHKFPFVCTAAILAVDWLLTASALNFFERCVRSTAAFNAPSPHKMTQLV